MQVWSNLHSPTVAGVLTRISSWCVDTYNYAVSAVVKKPDMLSKLKIQPRDLRFSTASSLFVRGSNIILRLQVSLAHCNGIHNVNLACSVEYESHYKV